jgi:AGZA family xanthine/uracil permease-like MFS transporter
MISLGMGLNALFATTFVLTYGYSWRAALGITLISGVLNLICVLFGVRKKFILALPEFYRIGLAVGVKSFFFFVSLQYHELTRVYRLPCFWRSLEHKICN